MRPIDMSRAAVAAALIGDFKQAASWQAAIAAQLAVADSHNEGLRGRIPIDVAFNLALAGCCDGTVFMRLCDRAAHEVQRSPKTRRRGSGLAVAQMAERAAAAGCIHPELFDSAHQRLVELGWRADDGSTVAALATGRFSLRHARAARWLHQRHHHHSLSATQRRVGSGASIRGKVDGKLLHSHFSDPTKDLSLDLGCGFGVGALALATGNRRSAPPRGTPSTACRAVHSPPRLQNGSPLPTPSRGSSRLVTPRYASLERILLHPSPHGCIHPFGRHLTQLTWHPISWLAISTTRPSALAALSHRAGSSTVAALSWYRTRALCWAGSPGASTTAV